MDNKIWPYINTNQCTTDTENVISLSLSWEAKLSILERTNSNCSSDIVFKMDCNHVTRHILSTDPIQSLNNARSIFEHIILEYNEDFGTWGYKVIIQKLLYRLNTKRGAASPSDSTGRECCIG